MIDAPTVGKS